MKYAGLLFLLFSQCIAIPSVVLKNAAVPGLTMPATGLGLGGYGMDPSVGYGGYPECFAEELDSKIGCGKYTKRAIVDWFKVGGRRLDSADSYGNEKSVGEGIKKSGVPRSDIFLLSKVGIRCPFGFNETLACFDRVTSNLATEYVDLLLIHYPMSFNETSQDPNCKEGSNTPACRLATWRAMIQIFNSGGAKAIGVSNYNQTHIDEIADAKLQLPSVNQCHFNPYGGYAQMELVKYCQAHDIIFLGYSPLGVPDFHKFPGPNMLSTPMLDPAVLSIAKSHGKSPAQVIMAWMWDLGIPTNPRSQNPAHMVENLDIYDIVITTEESKNLMELHQDTCEEDPDWYECGKTLIPVYLPGARNMSTSVPDT